MIHMKTKLLAIAVGVISLVVIACDINESTVDVNETIPSAQKTDEKADVVTVENYFIETKESNAHDLSFLLDIEPGAKRLRLKYAGVHINGTVDKRIILKTARQHNDALISCYEKVYSEHESKSGIIVAAWDVTPQGTVDKITIKQSDFNHAVGDCIKNSIKSWNFSTNKLDDTSHVEYPFVFEYD